MLLIYFYGSLASLPWSRCWNGARESMKKKITSLGMTQENGYGPLTMWVVEILQDSGHEGPAETT
jgi:hypothetical protein